MRIFNFSINHEGLYYYGLILTAICMPLSRFALSVSMIILLCNWIFELDFKKKWLKIKENPSILIFSGAFLVHVIWLLNSKNFAYAFHDLSNKAIFLLFPIIIGTSRQLSLKQIKSILVWFSLAVVSSTIISATILFQFIDYPVQNIRDISPFISHIRLSLLINISIFSLSYIIISQRFLIQKIEIFIYIIFIIWLFIFLFLLKSYTGLIVFAVLFFGSLSFVSFKIKDLVPRLFLQVALITVFLLVASYITHSISRYYTKELVDIENLESFTRNGNKYKHYINRDIIENGNYVWLYVCEKELEKQWNEHSAIAYKGKDAKGQEIKYTLIRYLTSKGFRKDSLGISKLSQQDIKNIESGLANYIFEDKYAIYPKIYDAIWQIDIYRKGVLPIGNSITLRFEYGKTAFNIIKQHPWFGVGTGDVQDSFNVQYEESNSILPHKYRLRSHNQYLTFLVSFGIIGSLLFWFCIFYPVYKLKAYKNYFFTVVFIIALLSFINEDTLETQIGITFFSYFYSLFLFGSKLNFKNEEDYVQES